MSEPSKADRSPEMFAMVSAVLTRYGSNDKAAGELLYHLGDLVDAGCSLTQLASEFQQRLADSDSVDGRVRLLIWFIETSSLVKLEIQKHARQYARPSKNIEDSLWDSIIDAGMSEDELSKRFIDSIENRAGPPNK